MAPEMIQGRGYTEKVDIWSLGITVIEMATGNPPRVDEPPTKVLMSIPTAAPPKIEGSQWSQGMKDFVAACLVKDPNTRPNAKELLNHAWLKKAKDGKACLIDLTVRYQKWLTTQKIVPVPVEETCVPPRYNVCFAAEHSNFSF
jgi:serine/threonine-protein kinase 24/25/MST4